MSGTMKTRETHRQRKRKRAADRLAEMEKKLAEVAQRNARLEREVARYVNENRTLRDENQTLRDQVDQLKQQLAAAKKNSSNSSKPPSRDIVTPPKPPAKDGKKRKRGGQPGHEQHTRPLLPTEAADHFEPYTLNTCPDCAHIVVLSDLEPEVLQQVEIDAMPIRVTEHQRLAVFRIDKSRGSKVLIEVLGTEFDGVLGCDYFSAYRKYMRECNVLVQFCMAHLIRDVKFLLMLPGKDAPTRWTHSLSVTPGPIRRRLRDAPQNSGIGSPPRVVLKALQMSMSI